jgi:hypothetical protein
VIICEIIVHLLAIAQNKKKIAFTPTIAATVISLYDVPPTGFLIYMAIYRKVSNKGIQ